MGVPGAVQVRLRAPRGGARVQSWSLPAYAVCMRSPSVMMATGEDLVLIRPRIAEALSIQNNDEVEFELTEVQERFRLKVKLSNNISSDVLIHDFFALGLASSYSADASGEKVKLMSGRELNLPMQEMWAGIRIVQKKGSACLFFDGASRNNPNGPAGYGFRITSGGGELVRGYGYAGMNRSNNEMEYEGLIEGLIWATRLDLQSLEICGDSELIIKQVTGEYSVRNHRLSALLSKVRALLEDNSDLHCTFRHIPREENTITDSLANLAIDVRENLTACNWPNINKLMKKNRF